MQHDEIDENNKEWKFTIAFTAKREIQAQCHQPNEIQLGLVEFKFNSCIPYTRLILDGTANES